MSSLFSFLLLRLLYSARELAFSTEEFRFYCMTQQLCYQNNNTIVENFIARGHGPKTLELGGPQTLQLLLLGILANNVKNPYFEPFKGCLFPQVWKLILAHSKLSNIYCFFHHAVFKLSPRMKIISSIIVTQTLPVAYSCSQFLLTLGYTIFSSHIIF